LVFSSRKFVFTAIFILGLLISYNISNGNNHAIQNIFGGGSNTEAGIEYAFSPLLNITAGSK
jgi:hypothetical protein